MTAGDEPHFDVFGSGSVPIGRVLNEHASLAGLFREYDRVRLAATFGGLLAREELQANSHRLEVLVHLALLTASGSRKPGDDIVEHAFNAMATSSVGVSEDPSEDVCVRNIGTSVGNFRVLGGTWESAGFHLQRLVSTLETLGDGELLSSLRRSVYGLLRLSDTVCERAGLVRNHLGPELPLEVLPASVRRGTGSSRRVVRFTLKEVKSLGIQLEDLAPFGFLPDGLQTLRSERIGHSRLERYPLVLSQNEIYLMLPTAVVPAITRFLIESFTHSGVLRFFAAAVAAEYSALFARTPLLGESKLDVEFRRAEGGLAAAAMTEVDHGLYLNFVFVADDLEDFGKDGVLGSFPTVGPWNKLVDHWVQQSWEAARGHPDFVGGLTLVVACGIGRGVPFFLDNVVREGWRVELISAADLVALSWLPRFKPLSVWRMLEARDRLAEMGVGLQNINGLLNLVGWMRQLDGHLVPHATLPDEIGTGSSLIMVQQNSLRAVRHEALTRWDAHVVRDEDGRWRQVLRDEDSLFAEDHQKPFYIRNEKPDGTWPDGVYESPRRTWWCSIAPSPGTSGHFAFELMRLVKTWVVRFALVLDDALPELPTLVRWLVTFNGDIGDRPTSLGARRMNYDLAIGMVSVRAEATTNVVEVVAERGFEDAFRHPENIAERALVQRTIEGFRALAGRSPDPPGVDALLNRVVPDASARSQHGFMARHFRDYVRDSVWMAPIPVDNEDAAILRLNLGWRFRDRREGSEINGKAECTSFLNSVVRGLEDDVCAEMRQLDRAAIIDFAFLNHESAIADRTNWHATAAAVLALHDDRQATLDVMTQMDFGFSAVLQSSRLMIEFALGEATAVGGRKLGRLQASRLMARIMMITNLGGWSDAIRWDAMEPRLRVSALGDVHANLAFHEEVIAPFGRSASEQRIAESMESYAEHMDDPAQEDAPLPMNEEFPVEFWDAWKEQFGASIEALRGLIALLEDIGIDKRQAILRMKRSELIEACASHPVLGAEARDLIAALTFRPRPSWRQPPPGFDARDLFPWRFRRRLSVLRRPLVQIDDESDPLLVIAPGIIRDAFGYMLSSYHRGDFHRSQLSPKMNRWAGRASDRRGHQFALEVGARMHELGWETRVEERVTALLRKGFAVDYGDVDVLAWRPETGRVVIMECKDVQFRKTDGEIAEQLADFRGLEIDGNRDLLRKHLDRLDVIRQHAVPLQRTLSLTVPAIIEGDLVFRNPVPMQFAWEQMRAKTALHIFDNLHLI